ncbi:MAG: transglycosylase domain-containing protein [Bacteroidia bacterium]
MNENPQQTPKETKPSTKPAPKKRSYRLPRMIFLGTILLVLLGITVYLVGAAQNLPTLEEIENPRANLSTQIISADGTVLQNLFAEENRINIELNEVSPHVVNALVATEDVRFYSHNGVDSKAPFSILASAFRGNLRGASTITQQLARNLFIIKVGRDRSAYRKVKEAIVAFILERKFTKQEIMMAYLNTVNIYGNAFGLEMASKKLFDRPARELSVEQAALVVGMLKGQGVYNPFRRTETALNRRNTVIDQMVKYELIGASIADSIKQISLEKGLIMDQAAEHVGGIAPYFREHVRQELKIWCAENGHDLYRDGLRVYTTIDADLQRHAEKAVRKHLTELQGKFDKHIKGREPYKDDPSILTRLMTQSYRHISAKRRGLSKSEIKAEFDKPVKMRLFSWNGDMDTLLSPWDSLKYMSKFLEVGMVSIEPTTGQVKAWVGGNDYRHFRYDHVAKGTRQVGSTFKPFIYAAAVSNGYKPCDQVLNQRVVFKVPDGYWEPQNADGKVGGKMSLRKGLARSENLVTAQLMKQLDEAGDGGPRQAAKMARAMGVESPFDAVPSLILGTADLNVKEMAGAYCTFANKGEWIEPIYITRIEDKNGNILMEKSPKKRKVLSEEHAYTMVELLRGVVDMGTARRLRYRHDFRNEIAGKTGTTQNHSDGWFIGVTQELTTAVWVGCAERQMRFRDLRLGQGASMALPIWAYYMKDAYEDENTGLEQIPFKRPSNYNVNLDCSDSSSANDTTGNPEIPDPVPTNEFEKYN